MKREAVNNKPPSGSVNPRRGRVVVTGDTTFATAREVRQLGIPVLEASAAERIVIDCGGVTRADSAGLARVARLAGLGPTSRPRPVSLQNLPASLLAIARISEVDELLTATG